MFLVVLNTLIETAFLNKTPSSASTSQCTPMQSNPLRLNVDLNSYKVIDSWRTQVTFCVDGVSDFGDSVQKIQIWQENLILSTLMSIRLRDYVRKWKIQYESCSRNNNDETEERPLAILCNRMRPANKCFIFSMDHAPPVLDQYGGKLFLFEY